MLPDWDAVFRLWAASLLAIVDLKEELCKGVEPDRSGSRRVRIDANMQPETIQLGPGISLGREILDQANREVIFDAPAVRCP